VVGPTLAYDIGLPVGCIGDYVAACRSALGDAMPGCESVYYGHIGDGNLHVMVWQPGGYHGEQCKDQVDLIVYGLVRRFGGSISAEHGIGLTKRQWLSYSRSDAELALMRTVKAALDPAGLLNPGKVIA
jgi:FAD/FMN-containing dehydrogenase